MEWFIRLDAGTLPAFNLVLSIAMSVTMVMTRLGLGTAAGRVDVWLIGTLLLLTARATVPVGDMLGTWLLEFDASELVFPLLIAGLVWQAEGMRALHHPQPRSLKRLSLVSLGAAVVAHFVQARFDARGLPALMALVGVLLVWNAVWLGKHWWGGRLLAAAAFAMLLFNVHAAVAEQPSPEQSARRALLLEMVWTLFGTAGFLQCLYQDIRDRLAAAANTDALTGALNRTGIVPMLRRDIDRAKREGEVAIVLCDLDHFKRINDEFGHPAGDKVLQRFVCEVKACLRSTDLLGRWGGEEFVLVLPSSSVEDAIAVTRRIQKVIAASPELPAFSFSAGIACAGEERVKYDLEQLLSLADQRLYAAKRNRNTFVWDEASEPAPVMRPANAL